MSTGTSAGLRPTISRVPTTSSFHAQHSLRRMATHETGEFTEHDDENDPEGLHTHEEQEDERDPPNHKDDEESNIAIPPTLKDEKQEVQLQDQTNLLPIRQVVFVFIGLTCALFCSLLDQTIVTTALPTLGRVFNRADIAPWVGTAYLLTSTAMQPIYGRLSDIFGRKVILLGSLGVFLVGSLACAVATSMIQLIVFRAIQGIGGGGILTLSMIIISDVVSIQERGKYQGIMGGVIALSNSIGPILGGIFTEKATWRWCFYINLPITSLAIIIIIFLLPLRRVRGSIRSKLVKLDWYGSVLTLSWATLILLGISWGGSAHSWTSPAVLAPLLIGIALLFAFLYVEGYLVPLPLVPLGIFKNKTVAAAMATTLLNGMVFYSTLYYLPNYFQVVKGVSAIRSGVLLLPLVLVQTVCSFTSGILTSKTGDYWYNLTLGFFIWTIALGLMSTIDENTHLGKLLGYQVLLGLGAGQTFQTSLVAIQASVERRDMATATGLRNFLRMLGGTLALAVCSAIVNNVVRGRLGGLELGEGVVDGILGSPLELGKFGLSKEERRVVIHAYARGIQACFWYMIPCAGISFFLTLFFIKRVSLKREDDAAKKAEAKAWVESKKAKHNGGIWGKAGGEGRGEGEKRVRKESGVTLVEGHESEVGYETGTVDKIEKGLEQAGRGMEEASGGMISGKEGLEQGPIGSEKV